MLRRSVRSVVAALAVALALLAAPSPARADIQTLGPIKWPGKWQVGFLPLGGQVLMQSPTIGYYKLNADVYYLVKDFKGGLGLWVGGGVGYGVSPGSSSIAVGPFGNTVVVTPASHDVQINLSAMLTFNSLAYALVPFVRAGGAGDVLVSNFGTGGGGGFRFGGGVHYWLLKWLGLGVEINFLLGGRSGSGLVGAGFFGTWDFGLGARFAF